MREDRLHPGSFKGAAFLLDASTITGGRKDIVHRFVNSDKQVVEDVGGLPRSFSLRCVIGGGGKYESRRGALLAAVESGESGTLVHPLYGALPHIVARSYTLEESLDDLGSGSITIVFERSDPATGAPVPTATTASAISDAADICLGAASADFAARWSASSPPQVASAMSKIRSAIAAVQSRLGAVRAAADSIDSVSNQLSQLSADVASLVRTPQALADSLYGLFASVGNLYATADATVQALVGLFGFGGNPPRPETTVDRAVRNINDDLIDSVVNLSSLAHTYAALPDLVFSSQDEIDELAAVLESQANLLLNPEPEEVELQDGSLYQRRAQGAVPRDELLELRATVQRFLDEQKASVSDVVTVRTRPISARLLAYQYYADSSRAGDLLRLNPAVNNVARISGDVRVLTDDD